MELNNKLQLKAVFLAKQAMAVKNVLNRLHEHCDKRVKIDDKNDEFF